MTKKVSERMKIDALLYLALASDYRAFVDGKQAYAFTCPRCKFPIMPEADIRWDHAVPHGIGGAHHYKNIRPMCTACHAEKTFHPRSKATTLGGDNFEIKKANRMARGGKTRRGPAMRSRPFSKIPRKFPKKA